MCFLFSPHAPERGPRDPELRCDRVGPISAEAPAGQESIPRSHATMGTLSLRGRRSEVASATSDDDDSSDWPAGGQMPGNLPERGGAGQEEDGGGDSGRSREWKASRKEPREGEEKGGGGGRKGQPQWSESYGDNARRNRAAQESKGTRPDDNRTGDQREDLHRASHGPGGSWLGKVQSLWTNRGAL
ncbi:hypothetical protein NDU88_006186 [Pleurodeles waltl]|uniref:Uncharacterized protein n=1 Tax=Pleurodeles waltl TaxID=8319 RepID=A0AAV7NQ16_PLEWA|nr:hypothetical protein NDU88_006186 [Pleurodeles waltl]